MELRHLRYFVIVAEEQNVTRAAARLHVSQPPLSRQMRDLEEELGVELFQRTAKSLALTEAGKLFLGEARAVLLRAEQAVQAVQTLAKGERSQLRVGYAPSLTVEYLPRALKFFAQECPGVRISLHDLSSVEAIDRLKSRKIDIALMPPHGEPGTRGLVFEKVVSYQIFAAVAVNHRLAQKRSLSLSQFGKEPFIGYSREDYPEYIEWIQEMFRPHGVVPAIAEEHDSASSLIAAVEAERGIALVTASMRCMTGPRIKLLPLTPALPQVVVGALYMKPPVRWIEPFIAAVRKAASQSILK